MLFFLTTCFNAHFIHLHHLVLEYIEQSQNYVFQYHISNSNNGIRLKFETKKKTTTTITRKIKRKEKVGETFKMGQKRYTGKFGFYVE